MRKHQILPKWVLSSWLEPFDVYLPSIYRRFQVNSAYLSGHNEAFLLIEVSVSNLPTDMSYPLLHCSNKSTGRHRKTWGILALERLDKYQIS